MKFGSTRNQPKKENKEMASNNFGWTATPAPWNNPIPPTMVQTFTERANMGGAYQVEQDRLYREWLMWAEALGGGNLWPPLIRSSDPVAVIDNETTAIALVEAKPELKDWVELFVPNPEELAEARKATEDWVMPDGSPVGSHDTKRQSAIALCLKALDAGYEPTTPPADWYCGTIELLDAYSERWPCKNDKKSDRDRNMAIAQFVAPMPRKALDAYNSAKQVFKNVQASLRIYSPDPKHFEHREVRPIDPVIIGRVDMGGGEFQYFEVARWDIASDLAHALNKLNK